MRTIALALLLGSIVAGCSDPAVPSAPRTGAFTSADIPVAPVASTIPAGQEFCGIELQPGGTHVISLYGSKTFSVVASFCMPGSNVVYQKLPWNNYSINESNPGVLTYSIPSAAQLTVTGASVGSTAVWAHFCSTRGCFDGGVNVQVQAPAMQATINNPSVTFVVTSSQNVTYSVNASNGTAPYSYQWYYTDSRTGSRSALGTGSSQSIYMSCGYPSIRDDYVEVVVSGSDGRQVTASRYQHFECP